MRILLSITVSFVFSIQPYAQFSRMVNLFEEANFRNSVIPPNGTSQKAFYMYNDSNDNLFLNYFDYNDRGDFTNLTGTPVFIQAEHYALTDVFEIDSSQFAVVIMHRTTDNFARYSVHLLNTNTGSLQSFSDPTNYCQGFVRSQLKNDSIVTYISEYAGALKRMTRPLNDLSQTNSQDIFPNFTYIQAMQGSTFVNDFDIAPDGTEYVCFAQGAKKIIKYLNGNVIAGNTAWTSTYSVNQLIHADGSVSILRGNKRYHFTSDLTSNTSELLPYLKMDPPYAYYEDVIAFNGNVIIGQYRNDGFRLFTCDENFAVLDSVNLEHGINLNRLIAKDNAFFVCGSSGAHSQNSTLTGLPLTGFNSSNLVLIKANSLSTLQPIIDYSQWLKTSKIAISPGNGSNLLGRENGFNPGAGYYSNGTDSAITIFATMSLFNAYRNGQLSGTNHDLYQNDELPGPYTDSSFQSLENTWKYTRGYYVSKDMVEQHVAVITYGNPNYLAPFGIREWPAHGDPALGQAANLAPFVDVNSNGIYEPYEGDYPSFPGDQCVLFISHESEGAPASAALEKHNYVYTYSCDTSEILERTIFTKQVFLSRKYDLDSAYLTTFIDTDIGNPYDDYVGTHVELGLVYAYNGDLLDEYSYSTNGFQTQIPVQGMTILHGAKQADNGFDDPVGAGDGKSVNGIGYGDGIPDNEYLGLSASLNYALGGVYNELNSTAAISRGLFPNGMPQIVNGVPVRHSFMGKTDPLFYSSDGINYGVGFMEYEVGNSPGDRRLSASSGPGRLYTNDTIVLDLAFITTNPANQDSVGSGLSEHFAEVTDIRNRFKNNSVGCGKTFDNIDETLSIDEHVLTDNIILFPNPFSNVFTIGNLPSENLLVELYDMNGKQLLSAQTSGKTELTIEAGDFSGGMFLVRITGADGTIVKRITK